MTPPDADGSADSGDEGETDAAETAEIDRA